MPLKLCRFRNQQGTIQLGALREDSVLVDLAPAGVTRFHSLLDHENPAEALRQLLTRGLPEFPLKEVHLCSPADHQEVWAAGATYLRSKTARMEESDFSATAYDRVYVAERPELFFKALPQKVAATEEPVGIRGDARWSVPEPELALVLNSAGRVVGYTIGNDMSSRDIEGENALYLPQIGRVHV